MKKIFQLLLVLIPSVVFSQENLDAEYQERPIRVEADNFIDENPDLDAMTDQEQFNHDLKNGKFIDPDTKIMSGEIDRSEDSDNVESVKKQPAKPNNPKRKTVSSKPQ